MCFHHIYLLQEREFINKNENIFKLGKTKQENVQRIKSYPKGSNLLLLKNCNNCDLAEKVLIQIFKTKFAQQTQIGSEYFKGNPNDMADEIIKYLNSQDYLTSCENETNDVLPLQPNGSQFVFVENEYSCFLCEYTTKRSIDYKRHMMSEKHKINEQTFSDYVFTCSYCSHVYHSKSGFCKHKQKCKKIDDIASHSKVHLEDEKQNVCEVCGKAYKSRMGLWRHKKVCKNEEKNDDTITNQELLELIQKKENGIKDIKDLIMKVLQNQTESSSKTSKDTSMTLTPESLLK